MNTLNLARINEQSPYEVWQTSEGDFNFQTDFDVFYRISFRIEQTIWDDGAYEFSIINQNQRSSPNDKKVRDTIFLIIEEFFTSMIFSSINVRQEIIVRPCVTDFSCVGLKNTNTAISSSLKYLRSQQRK